MLEMQIFEYYMFSITTEKRKQFCTFTKRMKTYTVYFRLKHRKINFKVFCRPCKALFEKFNSFVYYGVASKTVPPQKRPLPLNHYTFCKFSLTSYKKQSLTPERRDPTARASPQLLVLRVVPTLVAILHPQHCFPTSTLNQNFGRRENCSAQD